MSKLGLQPIQWWSPRKRQVFDPQKRYAQQQKLAEQLKVSGQLERSGK
jgi:hypothetical protein